MPPFAKQYFAGHDAAVFRGYEGVKEYMRRWAGIWSHWAAEPEQFIETDGDVVVVLRHTATAKAGGIEVAGTHAVVFTVVAGKLTRLRDFARPEDAIEAVGLSA